MDWQIDLKGMLGPRRLERSMLITEAAIKCFAKYGFAETNVRLITETAGIQRTQFYLFYESKTDCFTACHRFCLQELESRILKAVEDATTWQLQITRGAEAVVTTFRDNPYLARLVIFEAELVGTEADKAIRKETNEHLGAALMDIFRSAAEPDVEVTQHMVDSAIGAVREVISRALNESEPEQLPQAAPALVTAVMAPCIGPKKAQELAAEHAGA